MTRHDWRLAPAAIASWAAAWLGTSGWFPDTAVLAGLTAFAAGLAVWLWVLRQHWLAVAVLILMLTAILTGWRCAARHDSPLTDLIQRPMVASIEVRVMTEPQRRPPVVWARAELQRAMGREVTVMARQPVVLLASGDVADELLDVEPGATYIVVARARAAEPTASEAAVLSVQQIDRRVTPPNLLDQAINSLRQGLRDAMTLSPPEHAALVPSLVVGDTTAVDEAMTQQFKVTGLAHLMAVSGSNLVLVLGAWLALLRRVGVRGWAIRVGAVLAVAGFVALCGQEPSVVRAAAMGLVALAATGMGQAARSLRGLFVAVLTLMWIDPWLSRSVGFALSAAACAGIVVLGPRLIASLKQWAPRWIAEALAVPLAAQLATQPIITSMSGQISLVAVLANVAAGPFVGPTTILGLAAALTFWAPPISLCLGWLAGWMAQPIIWVAQAGAAMPTPAIDWPVGVIGTALATVAAAGTSVALPILLRRRVVAVTILVAVIALSVTRVGPLGWPGHWQAMVCDVGQGDATLIRAGESAALLVDAAPDAMPVMRCLDDAGVNQVPLLVLTHFHADHTGGAEEVIGKYRPQLVLTREGLLPGWLLQAAQKVGSEVRAARPGEVISIGAATWTTVSVGDPGADMSEDSESSAENNASVIGVATSDQLRLLLAGDAEPAGQSAALRGAARLGLALSVHVLKLPHHGSSRQDERFFAASAATLAVASAGAGNDYGHPAQSALDLAREHGMSIARTDTEGAIAVELATDGLRVLRRGT